MHFALTILSAALLWVFSPTQSIYMIWFFAQSHVFVFLIVFVFKCSLALQIWVFSPTQSIYMIWVFAQSLKWSGLGLIARASKECTALLCGHRVLGTGFWIQSTGQWVLNIG